MTDEQDPQDEPQSFVMPDIDPADVADYDQRGAQLREWASDLVASKLIHEYGRGHHRDARATERAYHVGVAIDAMDLLELRQMLMRALTMLATAKLDQMGEERIVAFVERARARGLL